MFLFFYLRVREIMRYFYTIVNAYYYYDSLKNILKNNNKIFNRVTDITISELKNLGIQVLVLDFDGVLNSHGELLPCEAVLIWLEAMQLELGGENIFIFSNKPLAARIQFFAARFPAIRFIDGVRKKPYPDGLQKIFQLKKDFIKEKMHMVLVDDRILTGMLATCIAGCQGFYIQKPYIQFQKRPMSETFFQILRFLERFWLMP